MEFDVFISYSQQDKTTADAACASLERAGIRCWIAPRDIVPGMDWSEAIVDAIGESKVMVLIFSHHANVSAQIRREVERAINKEIPIIPFRIEDVAMNKSLEFYLSTQHWLNAITPPLESHLTQLATSIKALMQAGPKETDISEHDNDSNTGARTRPGFGKPPSRHFGLRILLGALAIVAIAGVSLWLALKNANILDTEPPSYTLSHGRVVFVNDHTCPRGMLKQVIGGSNTQNIPRQRRCVPCSDMGLLMRLFVC